MRFLKALVVIMGVLIIVGVAILVVELYKRSSDPERVAERAAEKAALALAPNEGGVALNLPRGARISSVTVINSRVVVTISQPEGDDRLYVLEPRTGALAPVLTTGDDQALADMRKNLTPSPAR